MHNTAADVLTATERPIRDCATDVWRLQSVELVIAVCRRLASTSATVDARYNLVVISRNCKLVCETSYFSPLPKSVRGLYQTFVRLYRHAPERGILHRRNAAPWRKL